MTIDSDTKQKIDEWLGRREIEEREKAKKEFEESQERIIENNVRKYNLKLWIHQRRFHCHIRKCENASPRPAERNDGIRSAKTLWDVPTMLERCKVCGKWTCTQVPHIYHGVCVECATNLKSR